MNTRRKNIKICQVVSADISLKFLLLEQMQYLQQAGFEVWAVSSTGKWIPEIAEAGISVYTVKITRKLFTPFADILALVRLVRFFRKERFDIVHTHTPKGSFLGQLAAFIARVPIRIYTVHGLFFTESSSWKRTVLFAAVEKIMAFLVHRAFFVNCEDMETVRRLRIYPASKIAYVGGDIDTGHLNPERFSRADKERKKKELGIPPGRKIVGIVARLVWEKGYADLFQALKTVLQKHPNAFLLIVGPEESDKEDGFRPQDAFRRYGLSRESVLFLGERTDVAELYSVMDVFVLPSYREGLGLSLLEASAMERPVVATRVRGCREAIDEGKTGLLVPPHSSKELAEAISFVLSHPQEAAAMGKAGREKVRREFEKSIVYGRIEKEYLRLTGERGLL